MPSSTCITHLPRCTGDVRSATEVSSRTLPWPRMPRRFGQRHLAELVAGDVRNAVVPGDALVDERVVGGDAARARCDPRARGARRRAPSRGGTPATATDPRRDRTARPAGSCPRPAGAATATRSGWPARSARGSASMRLTSASRPARVDSAFCMRRLHAALVGHRAPQEERQSRGELDVSRCDRCRPVGGRRRALGAEHEPRIREDRLHDQPDAVLEVALLAALAVEPHRVLQVRGRGRAAERAIGEAPARSDSAHFSSSAAEVGRHEKIR